MADVDRRAHAFALALSICKAVGKIHPATIYLISASSITVSFLMIFAEFQVMDRAVKERLWRLGKRLATGSSSFLVSSALVCLAAVAHVRLPMYR